MENYGEFSTISKDNQYALLFAVTLDTEEILKVFNELINDEIMITKIYKLHCAEYARLYGNNSKCVTINRTTSFKREEEVDQEKDKDGFVWAERRFIGNTFFYTFDLLNEPASILYNHIMNLENNNFDDIISIIIQYRIYKQKNASLSVKDYHEEIGIKQDEHLLGYYERLVNAITIRYVSRKKVDDLLNKMSEAQKVIENANFMLKHYKK